MVIRNKIPGQTYDHIRRILGTKDFTSKIKSDELPLRSELFSAEQMYQHGKNLAGTHKLTPGSRSIRILKRLAENEAVLLEVYNLLNDDAKAEARITPAGEWLLDNFYLIEEQIRTTKRHLPKGYSRELPHLQDGLSAGMPRVYDLALEIISHGDGKIDLEYLSSFVEAYQSANTLKIGELWAIPIMLRLALMENLRRVAARLAVDRKDRNLAEYWAEQIIDTAANDPKSLILTIADMAKSKPPLFSSFVAELTHRLQGQVPALTMPLAWIEQRLIESDTTIEQIVRKENQQQAANQISISNSIGSLRVLSAMDWSKFVESMSRVEDILYQDPADVYDKMDFPTRDSYRHVVEELSRRSAFSETEVARFAVDLATEAKVAKGDNERSSHVGYYLVDDGLAHLKAKVHPSFSISGFTHHLNRKFVFSAYISSILILTGIITGGVVLKAAYDGLFGWGLGLLGLLVYCSSAQLSVALINWFATKTAAPLALPRMDYTKGIPKKYSSLVVIPTLISSIRNVSELVKALEVRYLANQDGNLFFALLTDFHDADEQTKTEDESLLKLAKKMITALNTKYTGMGRDTFFLFHRPRVWNPKEHIWMGYERKRGKLAALNGFLRGSPGREFALIVGNTAVLADVKYVITLDTDTQLPRDAACKFVATMAHPLNRAVYSESLHRVVKGYGILQPRLAISMQGAIWSRYTRMCSTEPGIDPYTRTVSDVYQDLFGEGSFTGKGIYDVDAFEQALKHSFPENRILSHDLLEGCYARAGLISDVQLYEDYPSRYAVDVSRRHRWIRGDWQIAQWILPFVPDFSGKMHKNPLSMLSRWKVFDNLHRSLTAAGLTLLLLLGWTLFSTAWFWTLVVLGIIMIPALLTTMYSIFHKPKDLGLTVHITSESVTLWQRIRQDVLKIITLPYEAFYSLDAVLRTLWRLFFSHKQLLEWNPSSEAERKTRVGLGGSYREMWVAPALAILAALLTIVNNPIGLFVALPVLGLWFASPLITWWLSLPITRKEAKLSADQTRYLRKLARKTWAFFDTFVTAEDHWLPPDNYQEQPAAKLAHRTSPTNIGLSLLANLTAFDFGMITAGQVIERTSNTFSTMEIMERFQGHFYNWYDTQTLRILRPEYVSTVDSGNLSGYLLTLSQGLLQLQDTPILPTRLFESLADTLGILIECFTSAPKRSVPEVLALFKKEVLSVSEAPPLKLQDVKQLLISFSNKAEEIAATLELINTEPDSREMWWIANIINQCKAALVEIAVMAPYIEHSSALADKQLEDIPTLRNLAKLEELVTQQLGNTSDPKHEELINIVATASLHAKLRIANLQKLARQCEAFARVKYDFLYDKSRHLLAIGYNVAESTRDAGYYDLLASEARVACFVAIAQGYLPQDCWFALGRLLTTVGGEPILLSWSGSMFEYLMPLLIMPSYDQTLLTQTYNAAVARQIDYGKRSGVPWGISESGYNAIDVHLNYQYRAFGVPGLGLKRGLAEDLVIAPYASVMALMVAPEEACNNLKRMSGDGFEAKYGFYEAVDYTPSRMARGQSHAVVRSFMAHHQGMSLLSFAYLLLNRPMQKRFAANPQFLATILLLQERIPKATSFYARSFNSEEHYIASDTLESPIRVYSSPDSPNPEVQLLSNGRYHVMVTNTGGGYSKWKDMAVTRWREDRTYDNWGTFCYIRDVVTGEYWSGAFQPTLKYVKHYEAIFSEGRAEFRGRYLDFETHTEIAVSPEDDIELRRTSITNRSRTSRVIDVTSYAEVVLAPSAAEALHPAFSNLFVQTEIIPSSHAIICTRRPRSISEKAPWMFHLMAVHGAEVVGVTYETDRMKFIGRGNTLANPSAMSGSSDLSGSQGSVLDPIVAIRYRIVLEPNEAVTINIVTGMHDTKEAVLNLINKYQDRRLADRVLDIIWTHGQVLLRQFNISEADAKLYGRLAGSIIYANNSMRAEPSILVKNRRGQSGLWGYAISGDLPIVLLQIEDTANIGLVKQLVQAHAYWRLKGLAVDLVIWNEDRAGYRQLLHDQIMDVIAAGSEANVTDQPGGIFVKPIDQIAEEDRILFQTVARVIINDNHGSLAEQIGAKRIKDVAIPLLAQTRTQRPEAVSIPPLPRNDLTFFNGLGGFTPDGKEYVITTSQNQRTPAPWVNILANPQFGTVISESGLAYTWNENAHEFRLTPWSNDPVSDSRGEAFYIRDEERGNFWSPTPQPCGGANPYVTRHGFGYSVFEHTEKGIRTEMWVYVALDSSIKFTVLKLRNLLDRPRRLSITGYVEWVLGDMRDKTSMHIITEIDPVTSALFAHNPYRTETRKRTAFFDVDDSSSTVTGDRTEFIGRNGTLKAPKAMLNAHLSGRVGAALDPCAAIQVTFDLQAGQDKEVIFRLGIGDNPVDARNMVNNHRGSKAAHDALDRIWQHWAHTLGAVNVETPDPALNALTNGWLIYQTLACRLWARSASYQSGGAFGFRDQLQDTMALIHASPGLVRAHILLCASRQFTDGDVQHWWHPPIGRGVRTRCSDDYLWLPYTACHYTETTGDTGILGEVIPFLQGRLVNPDEDSYYDLPAIATETASLYEHCVRAIMNSFKLGVHGLPLIGTGDWNDGMNLVGEKGTGESIWLGFFLFDVLHKFAPIAQSYGDLAFAETCLKHANELRINIESYGWDGEWYRRAYFDDGTPLGSKENKECQIDSISQSWSVLSGAGESSRTHLAMQSLNKRLVNSQQGLIQLLEPPFDKSALNPGYIKGYVPGVRENGGQYTHAAIWATMAFAKLGDNKRAWELFNMINPVNHARTPEETDIYKVEPYVTAADVYAVVPHNGRGGWTWYTGSAAWMYRLILESLLGIKLEVDKLHLSPCLPAEWEGFVLHYRYRETVYHINVRQVQSESTEVIIRINGTDQPEQTIQLVDDQIEHSVEVIIPIKL